MNTKVERERNRTVERKRREADLWDFRQKFKRASKEERLKLLVRMADAKYDTGRLCGYSLERMRERFNVVKSEYRRLHGYKCDACFERPAVARHHVIQLQNGGMNHTNNLIRVCGDCHNIIHPWMAEQASA